MSDRHRSARQEVLVQGPFPISEGGKQDPAPAPPSSVITRERRLGLFIVAVIALLATLIALGVSNSSNQSGDDTVTAQASTTATSYG